MDVYPTRVEIARRRCAADAGVSRDGWTRIVGLSSFSSVCFEPPEKYVIDMCLNMTYEPIWGRRGLLRSRKRRYSACHRRKRTKLFVCRPTSRPSSLRLRNWWRSSMRSMLEPGK